MLEELLLAVGFDTGQLMAWMCRIIISFQIIQVVWYLSRSIVELLYIHILSVRQPSFNLDFTVLDRVLHDQRVARWRVYLHLLSR